MIERNDDGIPDLVSLAEAAAILRMTKPAAVKHVRKGNLSGRKIGGTWVFQRSEVLKLAARLGRNTTES